MSFLIHPSAFLLAPSGRADHAFVVIKKEAPVSEKPYDLRIRTKDFALNIIRMFGELPKSTVALIIGRQILRSGTSVGANYREAHRGRSKAEFIAKCGDSLRELEETSYWLELLADAKVMPAAQLDSLQLECGELTAIFVTILKRAKRG